MCTPGYDITLDRFMKVAHLPPPARQRGGRQPHVRQRPAVDAPHGSPAEGPAGALRQVDHRLPAVQPPVRERRDRAPVHGIAGGAHHRGEDPGARHGPHEREGRRHAAGAPKKGAPGPSASPGEGGTPKFAWHPTARACVFCQIEVVQNSVSVQSEKAAGFSPIKRKTRRRCSSYPIRAWVRLYDSPSNLIILP